MVISTSTAALNGAKNSIFWIARGKGVYNFREQTVVNETLVIAVLDLVRRLHVTQEIIIND